MDAGIAYLKSPIEYLNPPAQWQETREFSWDSSPEESRITHINKKLVLMIDLSYTYEDIETEFAAFLRRWERPSPERKRQGTNRIDNIWEIYKEKTLEGKNLLEITRNFCQHGPKANPNYTSDKAMWANYKAVERAYNKASKIITEIEKQADNPSL